MGPPEKAMMRPFEEQHYDELLRLLEEGREWSQRAGTLSEAEMGHYHRCLSRIEQLVVQLSPEGGEKPWREEA